MNLHADTSEISPEEAKFLTKTLFDDVWIKAPIIYKINYLYIKLIEILLIFCFSNIKYKIVLIEIN